MNFVQLLRCSVLVASTVFLFSSNPSFSGGKEKLTAEERLYIERMARERAKFHQESFRSFKLENGLEVLLVHNPKAQLASAAMDVKVGFWQDPAEYPGLAHYLEHMLFLGSEKFGGAAEYRSFISRNMGYFNAVTKNRNTNFHFEINPSAFSEALDRLSDFFIHPNFNETYLPKELEAIESEYLKNADNDAWRVHHLHAILANPAHPQFRVFQGNKATLGKIPRARVIEFFKKYYIASEMKLALVSALSLDEMEGLVSTYFKGLPSGPSPSEKISQPLVLGKDLPRLIEVKSKVDAPSMTLVFQVPDVRTMYYSSPGPYLSNLLRQMGPGSLSHLLSAKGWIAEITGGMERERDEYQVTFALSQVGLEHWDEIVSSFFSYIEFLKKRGLSQEFFEEERRKAELNYTMMDGPAGIEEAEYLSTRSQLFSPNDFFLADNLRVRPSAKSFQSFLMLLDPARAEIYLASKDVKTARYEPLYSIDYSVTSLSSEVTGRWSAVSPDSSFELPKANSFLPERLDLIGTHQEVPFLFKKEAFQELWIQTDHKFKNPKVQIHFQIQMPRQVSLERKAVATLYFAAIEAVQVSSQARAAGYYLSISAKEGVSLFLGGYTDKVERFAEEEFQRLFDFDLPEGQFQTIKARVITLLENEKQFNPSQCASIKGSVLLDPYACGFSDLLPFLRKVTLADIKDFAKRPFPQGFVRGYGFGNISREILERITSRLRDTFRIEPLDADLRPRMERVQFLPGQTYTHWSEVSGRENVWMAVLQMGATSPQLNVILSLASAMIQPAFFAEMRTERNLGYIVRAGSQIDSSHGRFEFLIQSDRPLLEVSVVAEEWLQNKLWQVLSIGEQTFESLKASLREQLNRDENTFASRCGFFDEAIFYNDGDLLWKQKVGESLNQLTLAEFTTTLKAAFDPRFHRKLVLFIKGDQGEGVKFEHPEHSEITDLEAFRKAVPRYYSPNL